MVSPLISLNPKPLSKEHLRIHVFHGTAFGKPSSCHKNHCFSSETSWEFLHAISPRPCNKQGLMDYINSTR